MVGDDTRRRALVAKALKECPERHRATVLVDAAAMEQRHGNATTAAGLLDKAWRESGDWKVTLEQTLACLSSDNDGKEAEALALLKERLVSCPGAGRLWLLSVQHLGADHGAWSGDGGRRGDSVGPGMCGRGELSVSALGISLSTHLFHLLWRTP